jgi:ribosomal protein L11 methyltransferase
VPSSWLQVSLRTDPSTVDAVSNFLIERGSPGVLIQKHEVRAYFPEVKESAAVRRDVQKFIRGIQRTGAQLGDAQLRWRVIKDRNWNSAWRRFFNPQKVGKKFVVTPPWIKPSRTGQRFVITIEPGLAFGTGTHATTRGCMEFAERAAASLRGHNFNALDVGTGSGILAIALAKLGATAVRAIDNDPVALKVARTNVALNHVRDNVMVSATRLSKISGEFSIVVANLTAETIHDLSHDLKRSVAPNGFLILSGILKSKADSVFLWFARNGFKLVLSKNEKEWTTLLFRRK